jgi:hypothetical protein
MLLVAGVYTSSPASPLAAVEAKLLTADDVTLMVTAVVNCQGVLATALTC